MSSKGTNRSGRKPSGAKKGQPKGESPASAGGSSRSTGRARQSTTETGARGDAAARPSKRKRRSRSRKSAGVGESNAAGAHSPRPAPASEVAEGSRQRARGETAASTPSTAEPAPPAAAPGSDRAQPVRYADEEAELKDVEAQIRVLEARLDGMIRHAEQSDDDPPSIREQVSFAAREVVDRLSPAAERPSAPDATVVDSLRDLLSSDYYLRHWGRLGMRNRSEDVDDFGLDPVYERKLRPLFNFLYKKYFRIEVQGLEHIPSEGRCLVVANHSGTIPLDGAMLRTCVRLEHPAERDLRWLAEDFVYYLPFVGAFMNRIGAVRACQENAERLLSKGNLVAVFPEGVKGIGKLYRDRYKLQRFGRGGFIRLCLRTQTPLVPCAIVGAEETGPMLYRDEIVSKAVGLPYLPITPTFPWFGPVGLMPAPTKWKILFGEPFLFDEYGPDQAEDYILVGRLADRIRTSIQQMLEHTLADRRSVWFG